MKQKFSTILLALMFDKDFYGYIDSDFHIFFSYCNDIIEDSVEGWESIFNRIADDPNGIRYINFVYDELQNFY